MSRGFFESMLYDGRSTFFEARTHCRCFDVTANARRPCGEAKFASVLFAVKTGR